MKNSRLFQLLYLLVERKGSLTAKELAQRFEVSERTIYRDVDALSAAGIPVYTRQGRDGGICLMEQFVLDRALLSPAEQDELLFALQAVLATQAADAKDTLARLSALFRRDSAGWLEVDFHDWGSGETEKTAFLQIKQAILNQRVLAFTYYSSAGERTQRRAEPVRFVFKSGCWYLQAFCLLREAWRTFRLARMEDPRMEETRFQPRPGPPEIDPVSAEDCPMAALVLRFAPQAAWRVRDYFSPRQIFEEQNGRLLVRCVFPENDWLLSFLLSFGDSLEILAPDAWRQAVAREAEKLAARYKT